ncbi:MAG: hypothetical protein GY939_06425, partial [Actinomycetia bacterium]|nr:hypothetical protein [Actinomycetes bacterium]
GNTHDSVGAVDRLRELIGDVRERLGPVPLEVRLDSAFCQKAVLDLLTASDGHPFSYKAALPTAGPLFVTLPEDL